MGRCNLFDEAYKINDFISIKIPTLGEVLPIEEEYLSIIYTIVATPYDMMVFLDDNHIDFSQITDWDLFCLLFNQFKKQDLSMIFGDLDLSGFYVQKNTENGHIVIRNPITKQEITRKTHYDICKALRDVFHIPRVNKKPGNEEARQYMLERARVKMARRKKKPQDSQWEKYIIALVNSCEFPYNYGNVREITLRQFYASVYQVVRRVQFDNLMIGCYAGTVNTKELDPKLLDWVS